MTRAKQRFSRKRRFRLFMTSLVTVALLGTGGYVAACAVTPLPEPKLEVSAAALTTVEAPGDAAQALVDAQSIPTAIGWLDNNDGNDGSAGSSTDVWSNDDTVYPIASITKLIMVLVALEHTPLEPGAEGDTYVWTEEDVALTDHYMSLDGISFYLPVGAELTQRDMLKFIFLPSANDVAHSYALWTFGSNQAFLAAFEEWKSKHGFDSITLIEPTGMAPMNTANAADLVGVARLAAANPTILEFTSMESAEMPWGVGTITNTNPLLGVMPGIIGFKTGTLYRNYNLVVAQQTDVDGREATSIAVTLARSSWEERAVSGETMLGAMDGLPEQVTIIEAGTHIGTLTSVDGQSADLVTESGATATLLPGEAASWELSEDHSSVSVHTPAGASSVSVTRPQAFEEPGLWWKITHPGLVFG